LFEFAAGGFFQVLGVGQPQPTRALEGCGGRGRQLFLELPPRLVEALLEVLHHMEAVDGDADPGPKHLLDRLHVAVPHVRRYLL